MRMGSLVIAVVLIGVVIGIWLLLQTYGRPAQWRGFTVLPLLRCGSLAIVILLVVDPELPVPRRQKRDWVVVVDGSSSMAVEDSSGRTRAGRAVDALPSRITSVPVLVMGETPAQMRVDAIRPSMLDGSSTNLAAMLTEASRMVAGLRRVILISDGRTIGPDPATLADMMGLEVSCIGITAAGEPGDVAIVDIVAPSLVIPDQRFTIPVSVRLSGGAVSAMSEVSLSIDGQVVAQVPCSLVPDTTVRIDLPCPGLPVGTAEALVQVGGIVGEHTLDNNARSIPLTARTVRWRVHIAGGSPGWDLAFLARGLRRDGGFDVHMAVAGGGPPGVPASLDALVVGQWGAGGDAVLRTMADAVLERGGAVVLLGWPAADPWDGVSPLLTVSEPGVERRLTSRPGADHPLLAVLGTKPRPPLTFPSGPVSVSPGAIVLLEADDGTPAVAVRPHARGYVLAWLGSDWWRWILGDPVAGESALPWPSILRWLLSPDAGRRIRLHPGKDAYFAGEPIVVGVEVFGPGWEPATEGHVVVTVGQPDSSAILVERRLRLAVSDRMPRIEIPGLHPGRWSVDARATLPSGETLGASATITVSSQPLEHELLAPDHRVLERLARATGGIVAGTDGMARIDSVISAGRGIVVQPLHVRRTPFSFVALLAFLGAEWWLRSRRGMP